MASPIEQFEIHNLMPIAKIGSSQIYLTNSAIYMMISVALIFLLLYFTYHNVIDALRVCTGIPFAWVGGIFALWLRDMPFSISAAVTWAASWPRPSERSARKCRFPRRGIASTTADSSRI